LIRSMTGYGSAKGTSGDLVITVEIKSVNNRFFDSSIRIPRLYSFAEETVNLRLQSAVARGKTDVFINIDSSKANDTTIVLNESLLEAYISAFKLMSDKYGLCNDAGVSMYSKLPDIFVTEKKEIDQESFICDLSALLDTALADFNEMRVREGEKLREDMLEKLKTIEFLAAEAAKRSPQTVSEYREKLYKRMCDLLGTAGVDESRILTEAAIYADKVAIDEELVRLSSHIGQFRTMLTGGGSVGRKLDFLVQELNREINTIGSKCTDVTMTRTVVDMKGELEKLREQIQNIE